MKSLDTALAFLAAALAPVLFYGFTTGKPAPVIQNDGTLAEAMAERFVREELRCPATASFPAADAKRTGDGWEMRSYVDAQNGFGANVCTHWTATVKDCGGDRCLRA